MDKSLLRTNFSSRALTFADSFRATLGRLRVGPHGYAPDMTAPDGPSTGGGVQSMQHLRLVPPEPSMPTLVVGYADQRRGAAELRSWERIDAMCRERYKQGAPLDPGQYEQFLESAQGFLASCGMRVALAAASKMPPPLGSARRTSVVVLAVALVAALGTIGWLLFTRH